MISICTSVIIITIISFLFTGTRVIVLPVLPNQCGERKEVCEHFMSLGWGPHQKPCHWQRPENHQLHQSSLLEPNFSRPAPFALFIAKTNLPYSFISYAAVIKDHKRQPLQKSFANKNLVRLHVPRKNTFFTHSLSRIRFKTGMFFICRSVYFVFANRDSIQGFTCGERARTSTTRGKLSIYITSK